MDSNTEKAELPQMVPIKTTAGPLPQEYPPLTKTKSGTSATLARISSRLTTHSLPHPGPPPDGGSLAWTQVFCAWLAIMNTWGFVNSFGAFQTYYASTLPQSNSTISWIGSTQACLLFILGWFSGRAFDAGWFRPTVILGIVLQVVGIFVMSAAKNYWQLLVTHGLLTGIGGGIFFVPVMSLVSTYFAKRRGLALGIVTTGNSLGGIVYPVVVRQLLGSVGFGWTVRVLGFINVVALLIVIAFMKPRLPPRKSGPLWDQDALRDWPYLLHVLGMCFLLPPVYFVFYYVASFARDELGMPYTESLNLVILLNGIGFPARILPGYIADTYLGAINTFVICLTITTITLWCWLAVSSISTYYAFITLYGLFCAAFQSLFPTTIAAYSSDISKTGTRLGMAFAVMGISALVGGPLSGALVGLGDDGFWNAVYWAGTSTFVGVGFCACARGTKWGWGVAKC